ncbi:MAG: GIY-YIG nuclease family protein [Dokdonella sp.]
MPTDSRERSPLAGEDGSDGAGFPRALARGQAYLYVIACRDDSLFKVGYSRDPLQRFRTLHPRFFEFFDLGRGILVKTERVAQARRLEHALHVAFAIHQAPAPVCVPASAAGHTEWFRGVLDDAVHAAREQALHDAFAHELPDAWLRSVLAQRKDLLFDWACRVFEAIEYAEHNLAGAGVGVYMRTLCDVLDAYRMVGIDPCPLLPTHVGRWYAARAR